MRSVAPTRRAGGREYQSIRPNLSRNALSVTITEEPDIASAAISGVTRPATATGTAMRL